MAHWNIRLYPPRKLVLPSAPKIIGVLIMLFALSGCASFFRHDLPKSVAEEQSSYSYIPLDPLPVREDTSRLTKYYYSKNTGAIYLDCEQIRALLECLPDQAVRIAVGQYDASGNLVFGPAKIGVQGNSYQIILDYVSVDTKNISVYIQRIFGGSKDVSLYDAKIPVRETQYIVHRDPQPDPEAMEKERYRKKEAKEKGEVYEEIPTPKGEKVVIPVYVGVGLRLTASIRVTKGQANLSSLGSIAADAQAGKLTGSLIVQTLGVTGKSVSTTIPLPSELNQTTIQNAILALGSIKAVLHDPNTIITPRVVGIFNPVGGGQQVVNGIISLLASDPIPWSRPCLKFQSPPEETPAVSPTTSPR